MKSMAALCLPKTQLLVRGMSRKFFACFIVLFFSSFLLSLSVQAKPSTSEEEVYFSPKGGCAQAIVGNLNWAEKYVRVQAYSFTSKPIAEALIAAHKRGVDVKVLLDKSQPRARGGKIDMLVDAGIPVMIDRKHAIAHNKVMIIDGVTVLTGSFNFTSAAEDKNAENLLVVRDKVVARKYRNNWNSHRKHSEHYEIPGKDGRGT
jgi:phosphatidylserine/phosphatidylglycerophosphate/cardiolipin synthase-like enzyme